MGFYWKVIETRSELLQNKLNELQSEGCQIIKVDLLYWDEKLRTGHYNIISRQAIGEADRQPTEIQAY